MNLIHVRKIDVLQYTIPVDIHGKTYWLELTDKQRDNLMIDVKNYKTKTNGLFLDD